MILHPAIPKDHPGAYPADVDLLARYGLISARYQGQRVAIDVTPKGFEFYAKQKDSDEQPFATVEHELRSFIDASALQTVFPEAIAKWRQAEALLWRAEASNELTAIGHHCREAMQLFASALERRYDVGDRQSDASKTIARIRAIIASRVASDAQRAFAEACSAPRLVRHLA